MAAFEIVFDGETRDRLVGSLVLVCGDRAIAEELAQDALAKGWAHWARISKFRSPKAWVWRCAFNAAASSGRRRSAELRAYQRSYQPVDHGPDPALTIALRRCIDDLSERQRAAIVCRYYSDLSIRETAKVLGCREGTVKALTSQAIDRLRSMDLVEQTTRRTDLRSTPSQAADDHARDDTVIAGEPATDDSAGLAARKVVQRARR